jgi:hypothetical protein
MTTSAREHMLEAVEKDPTLRDRAEGLWEMIGR